jgi:adenosylcobalamin-dependent ribonucleoside-triphosphate reductase
MILVTKRDGRKQPFDRSKIDDVIKQAFNNVYGEEKPEVAADLAELVNIYDGIPIEEIQDQVQRLLMKNHPDVAEHFILYREKRRQRRESIKQVHYSSEYLTPEFLSKYQDYPAHMNAVSKFTYLRTYSRDIVELGRRETYKETCIRSVDHNIGMDTRPRTKEVMKELREEAEKLFDLQFNLRGFLSGRALFTGGSSAAEKFPLSLFNCSFVEPNKLQDFYDILYLLSVGAGVGYRITWDVVDQLPLFRKDVKLEVIPYDPVPKTMRKEKTQILQGAGLAVITVGDSRDGWGRAVVEFLKLLSVESDPTLKKVRVIYNNIRPSGTPLKTFGGYASGPQPLMKAMKNIHEALTGDYMDSHGNVLTKAPVNGKLRPIHVMHIANLIANAIVVGGVRRSAMIALFSRDDNEMTNAKVSFVDYGDPKISHYWLSNNTMVVEEGYTPTREEITTWIERVKTFGEPGFMNENELKARHPKARGMNPCAEILLRSYQTCNLVTQVLTAYVKKDKSLDMKLLAEDLGTLSRSAYRVTLNELELPHWNQAQEEDRLLGVSPTAWMDMVEMTDMTNDQEAELLRYMKDVVNVQANAYADRLGLNHSFNKTAVKPSGTLGLLANGTSAGVHMSHSPFYYRTIRVAKSNPMFEVIKRLNWRVEDDVTKPNDVAVVYFPTKSGVKRTKYDVSAVEQLDRYKRFQENYTEQNTSVTISVQNHEWESVIDWLENNWAYFTAVSFLPLTDHKFLQAPYQDISEEEYNKAVEGLDQLDHELLTKYLDLDEYYKEEVEDNDPNCGTGACGTDRI